MLTSQDLKSVQHMIEQADYSERDFLKAHAEMEIDIINSQCLNRMLTEREQRAFEFAIETLTQLETREQRGNWWYTSKRRNELKRQYLDVH